MEICIFTLVMIVEKKQMNYTSTKCWHYSWVIGELSFEDSNPSAHLFLFSDHSKKLLAITSPRNFFGLLASAPCILLSKTHYNQSSLEQADFHLLYVQLLFQFSKVCIARSSHEHYNQQPNWHETYFIESLLKTHLILCT